MFFLVAPPYICQVDTFYLLYIFITLQLLIAFAQRNISDFVVMYAEVKQTPTAPLVTAPKPQTTTRLPPTRERPRPFSPRPTTPATFAPTVDDSRQSESGRVPQIVVASAHPQDNEIPDSVHVHNNLLHNGADLPTHSTDDRTQTFGAKLNLGTV